MKKKKPTFEERMREDKVLPFLKSRVQHLLPDAQNLQDEAVSNAILKGWKKYPSFAKKKGDFPGWMYAILENTCKDVRREDKRNRCIGTEDVEKYMELKKLNEMVPDPGGMPQSVESYNSTLELKGKMEEYEREGADLLDDFLKSPIDGQSFHDWYEEDGSWRMLLGWGVHWHLLILGKPDKHTPKMRGIFKERLKGTSTEEIVKKLRTTPGAIHTAISKIRKDLKRA